MSLARRHRLITVLFALCSLLFMQLAVAGHACPGAGQTRGEAAAMAAAMPCSDAMPAGLDDGAAPGLCQAHCQADKLSADKFEVPSLPALPAPAVDFCVVVSAPVYGGAPIQTSLLERTTAPPMAVRHCCFRI
jgi:hypothetical protein